MATSRHPETFDIYCLHFRRRRVTFLKNLGKAIAAVGGGFLIWVLAGWGVMSWTFRDVPKPPPLVSDVPIVHELGWWTHQDQLTITKFDTQVVYERNMGEHSAIVEYRFAGTLDGFERRRPYIDKLHVSRSRVWDVGNAERTVAAKVDLLPVVSTKEDPFYTGEPVEFEFIVQEKLPALDWANHIFYFSSLDKKSEISFFHNK